MFAWLLRILLAGLVSMLTLQDVFLDSSWQGTFKLAIIDLFTSHCSVRELTLLTWTREGMLSRLMRATEIRLRDIPTACFSDELNWPVPFCICLHKCKACCDLEYMCLSKCTLTLTRPGLYPTESISTFLYFTFEWLVLLSCLHSGITNLSLKEGLSQTTSYGSFMYWSDALFLSRFADVFTGRMKLFLIFLFLGSTGSFLWFSLLCQQIIPFSRGEYLNLS